LARLRRLLLEPPAPLVAVEVRSRGIGVVRLARQGQQLALAAAASLELPEGVLVLSMTQPNLADPEAFRRVLGAALERAGALDAGGMALVLPDPVARIALLPAGEARAGGAGETEELLRFRLRKSVPFDIRQARLAWTPGEPDWLAAVISRPVLEEYEAACRSFGLQPGLVEVSGLSLFDAAIAGRPAGDRLIVNWDDDYVSFLLSRAGRLSLVRTLAGPGAAEPGNVAREAAQTVLYYRDRLQGAGLASAAVRVTGGTAAEASELLTEPFGLSPEILDAWGPLAAAAPGPAGQALAGAAASLLRSAA
jgi:hypothetical protein